MDKLYFSIFNNIYIRKKIFNYIKEYNSKLLYSTYDYYEFPLLSVIKNRDERLLLEKLELYKKYILQIDGDNGGEGKEKEELYKFYIDFNKKCFKSILNWSSVSTDTFKMVYQLFDERIAGWVGQSIMNIVYGDGGNLESFKYLLEKQPKFIKSIDFHQYYSNIKKCAINLNESSIQIIEYMVNKLEVKLTISIILKLLNQSVNNNIGSSQFTERLLLLFLPTINNLQDKNTILFTTLNYIIAKNDGDAFNNVISIYYNLHYNTNTDLQRYQLYGNKISKEVINKIDITRESLFKSGNLELFEIMYDIKVSVFTNRLTGDIVIVEVNQPDIANFLIFHLDGVILESNSYKFNLTCLNDLSNSSKFKKLRLHWCDGETSFAQGGLTESKLSFFIGNNISIKIGNLKTFNSDVKLFIKYFNHFKEVICNDTFLNYLKSSILNGEKEIFNYLMFEQSSIKKIIFQPNYQKDTVPNINELKHIFNVYGTGDDIMPFRITKDNIISLKCLYSHDNSRVTVYPLFRKCRYKREYCNINLKLLPIDPISRQSFLNEIYEYQDSIMGDNSHTDNRFKTLKINPLSLPSKFKKSCFVLIKEYIYLQNCNYNQLCQSNNLLFIFILSIFSNGYFNFLKDSKLSIPIKHRISKSIKLQVKLIECIFNFKDTDLKLLIWIKENNFIPILNQYNGIDIMVKCITINSNFKLLDCILGIGEFKYLNFNYQSLELLNFIHYSIVFHSVNPNASYRESIERLVKLNYQYHPSKIIKFQFAIVSNLDKYQLQFLKNVNLFVNFKSILIKKDKSPSPSSLSYK